VYNLHVDLHRCYAVGRSGALVHNFNGGDDPPEGGPTPDPTPAPIPSPDPTSAPGPVPISPPVPIAPDPIEIHHNLPQQFKEWFEDSGLNIADYEEPLPRSVHRLLDEGLHTGEDNWNELWAQFFADYPNANDEQILEFLDEIRALKGLDPW
jgi:hypothetical protein